MNDRDRLLRMLKAAARPKLKRVIVCYDTAWAGLPRVTVHDRPRRAQKRRRIITTARAYHRAMRPEQLALL